MICLNFLLAILLLLISPMLCIGATYYVDKNHGSASDSNPGTSPTLPLATIANAVTKATTAGDVVTVTTGDYTLAGAADKVTATVTASGSVGNYIKFQCLPRRTCQTFGWILTGNFIEVNGFDITQKNHNEGHVDQNWGIRFNGDNHRAIDNAIHDVLGTARAIGGEWYGTNAVPNKPARSSGNYVAYNTLYRTMSGIYMEGDGWLVEYNEVYGGWKPVGLYTLASGTDVDYLRFFGEDHLIRRNHLHDVDGQNVDNAHVDCFQSFQLSGRYTKNVVIEENICTHFLQGIYIEAYNQPNSYNVLMRRNVLSAYHLAPPPGATTSGTIGMNSHDLAHVIFVHNTVQQIGDPAGNGWSSGECCSLLAKHGRVYNNIFTDFYLKNTVTSNNGMGYTWKNTDVGGPNDTDHAGDYNLLHKTRGAFLTNEGGLNIHHYHAPHDLTPKVVESDLVGRVVNPTATLYANMQQGAAAIVWATVTPTNTTTDGTIRASWYSAVNVASDLTLTGAFVVDEQAVFDIVWEKINALDPLFANKNDFAGPDGLARTADDGGELLSGSPAIDAGGPLTVTIGAGSGTTLMVENARFFSDGKGWIDGDLIQIGANRARVTAINYDTGVLTLATALTWSDGQGVSYAYNGAAPDIGPYESDAPIVIGEIGGIWDFEDGSGTVVTDTSGNANNGTLVNLDQNAWVRGNVGRAIACDADGYVTIPDDVTLNIPAGQDFTAIVQVRTKTAAGASQWPLLFGKFDLVAPRDDWTIYRAAAGDNCAGKPCSWVGEVHVAGAAYFCRSTIPINDGKWHQLALVRQGEKLSCFQNDTFVQSATNVNLDGSLVNTGEVRFCNTSGDTSFFSGGRIDNAQLINRALTPNEIRAINAQRDAMPRGNRSSGRVSFSGSASIR